MHNSIVYKDWLIEWLDSYVKPTVKIRTYEKYCQISKNHIMPELGRYNMKYLNAQLLQSFIADKCLYLSSNYVNSIITVLKQSITAAHSAGITKNNYTTTIKRPKKEEKRIESLNLSEQKKIENFIIESEKEKYFGIFLCLYTGVRIGELLALEWQDIDFKNNIIYINKSCHYGKDYNGNYRRIVDTPKTYSGNREIPIPTTIIPYIYKVKNKSECDFVVSNKRKPVPTRSYQALFNSLLKKLSIPHKNFHCLRHTFATRAIESGIDAKTLSEILGHKNPTITLKRYTHSLLEHKISSMNKLNSIFTYNHE